jgi:hypothetical protein
MIPAANVVVLVGSLRKDSLNRKTALALIALNRNFLFDPKDGCHYPLTPFLDWISQNMHWNFQATKPTLLEDVDPVHAVAFKLFAQHVAGADQLVEYLEQTAARSIRPPDTMQRLCLLLADIMSQA